MPWGKNELAGNTIKTGNTNPSTNKTKFTQLPVDFKIVLSFLMLNIPLYICSPSYAILNYVSLIFAE